MVERHLSYHPDPCRHDGRNGRSANGARQLTDAAAETTSQDLPDIYLGQFEVQRGPTP